jgi:hypothetical protein
MPTWQLKYDIITYSNLLYLKVGYPGLDHGGSSDRTKANPHGSPERVAEDLLEFFRG